MAQSTKLTVDIDFSPARRKLRSLLSLAREVNSELTALEARIDSRQQELARLGIRFEVEEK